MMHKHLSLSDCIVQLDFINSSLCLDYDVKDNCNNSPTLGFQQLDSNWLTGNKLAGVWFIFFLIVLIYQHHPMNRCYLFTLSVGLCSTTQPSCLEPDGLIRTELMCESMILFD